MDTAEFGASVVLLRHEEDTAEQASSRMQLQPTTSEQEIEGVHRHTDPEFKNVAATPFNFWTTSPESGDFLDVMIAAIADLKRRGLTGVHVMGDFIQWHLSPLKARKEPAWVNPAGHNPDHDSDCKSFSSSEFTLLGHFSF